MCFTSPDTRLHDWPGWTVWTRARLVVEGWQWHPLQPGQPGGGTVELIIALPAGPWPQDPCWSPPYIHPWSHTCGRTWTWSHEFPELTDKAATFISQNINICSHVKKRKVSQPVSQHSTWITFNLVLNNQSQLEERVLTKITFNATMPQAKPLDCL